MADATVKNDPEFIADISQLWAGEKPYGRFVREFLERLRGRREVDQEEEYQLEEIIDRVKDLQGYPFTALEPQVMSTRNRSQKSSSVSTAPARC